MVWNILKILAIVLFACDIVFTIRDQVKQDVKTRRKNRAYFLKKIDGDT